MPNKLLITGATGNIGTQLIKGLDSSTCAYARLLTNKTHIPRMDLPPHVNCEVVPVDLLKKNIDHYLSDISHVIHLAALTDTAESHRKPHKYLTMNFDLVKKLADACLKKNIKLLFPSTTSIYASPDLAVDETCKELKSYSPYAEAKLKTEKYLLQLKRRGLRFVICRLGTVFGYSKGMRFNTAVNKFVKQAVDGIPLSIWKDVWTQKRPYLHIKDCVSAFNFIIKKDLFDGEIYNVLSGNHTVEDVVRIIKRFYPKLAVDFVNHPTINPRSYEVRDTKIRKLGFKPSGTLLSGIKETIKSLQK